MSGDEIQTVWYHRRKSNKSGRLAKLNKVRLTLNNRCRYKNCCCSTRRWNRCRFGGQFI